MSIISNFKMLFHPNFPLRRLGRMVLFRSQSSRLQPNQTRCCFCKTASSQVREGDSRKIMFGQPTPSTHPHLMQAGQVTPGLTKEEYQERRFRLMDAIATHTHESGASIRSQLVIVPSATKLFMSDKIPYTFRQNTEFLYLCGFQEPDSVLVLHTVQGKNLPDYRCMLFVPKKNQQTEIWEGPRSGVHGAMQLLGVDEASEIENLEEFLQAFLKDNPKILLWYDALHPTLPSLHQIMKDFIAHFGTQLSVESPRILIQRLRLIKSEAEIRLMRLSTEATALAMKEVIKWSHPNVLESHLNAKMDFECRMRGAERLAYPPVVAGGPRAHIIHYTANDQQIHSEQMVLMDAGGEYHGYTSDLTRTWPVDGCFTPPQKELYEAVLSVQNEMIELCSNFLSLDQLFHIMCQLLGTKLQELGIVRGTLNKIELSKLAYKYCPHHVGHYLGMDVHDTTLISRNLKLVPGMIITIEPGIYINENNYRVPAKYRGLNIRIEDDVLITDNGPEVLTAHCPKSVHDLEHLLSKPKK